VVVVAGVVAKAVAQRTAHREKSDGWAPKGYVCIPVVCAWMF
jgi:hypothetical protein